jgi:AraC family transcriptional regulator
LPRRIPVETLGGLVQLSPFHFSRVFKQTTGLSPLQVVTRERTTCAQKIMREIKRGLSEIVLEDGCLGPSAFAQVFCRDVGVSPTSLGVRCDRLWTARR